MLVEWRKVEGDSRWRRWAVGDSGVEEESGWWQRDAGGWRITVGWSWRMEGDSGVEDDSGMEKEYGG